MADTIKKVIDTFTYDSNLEWAAKASATGEIVLSPSMRKVVFAYLEMKAVAKAEGNTND